MKTNKLKLITHNGSFHADDIFACATLSLLLEKKGEDFEIIRTRDPKIIEEGDYVFDVGGVYDEDKNRFDHHQRDFKEKRPNGISYSSFGLVWKTYGEILCGNKEVADKIDKKIVCSVDAHDNGISIIKPLFDGIFPYEADQVFLNYKPTWKENNEDIDSIFKEQVKRVSELLFREIEVAGADIEGRNIILNIYNSSFNKQIIVLENEFPRYLYQNTLSELPEPIYVAVPSGHSDLWKVEAIKKSPETMESRKLFPEEWRGFFPGDLKIKEITGVKDASFSHKSGFLMISESKEGAIKLAELALEL